MDYIPLLPLFIFMLQLSHILLWQSIQIVSFDFWSVPSFFEYFLIFWYGKVFQLILYFTSPARESATSPRIPGFFPFNDI